MYKLIFADDESIVRKRIESMIDWEQEGFTLLGCCANGYELMNLVEKELPDLVILDINMPFITGLEAAKQITSAYPSVRIIFLTGYTEFSYAQKALELGALQYIVKPVDTQALLNALRDVRKRMEEARREAQRVFALETAYRRNGQLLLEDLLRGGKESDMICLRAQALGLPWNPQTWFQAAVLSVEAPLGVQWTQQEQSAIGLGLCNETSALLSEKKLGMACCHQGKIVVVGYGESREALDQGLQTCLQTLLTSSTLEITAGLSEPGQGCTALHKLFPAARQALRLQRQYGGGRLYTAQDLQGCDTGNQMVWAAISYIEKNYADTELSASSVCEHLHISSSYLRTLFKAQTGTTMISYITKIRMEKARELIMDQELKTSRIAQMVGYNDPHYFSYCFRRYYGMNPAEFRAGNAGNFE